jgi:hypothetical protein
MTMIIINSMSVKPFELPTVRIEAPPSLFFIPT